MPELITTESTSWLRLKLDCIANYEGDIKIGQRTKKEGNTYYTKEISIELDHDEMVYARDLINHYIGEREDGCIFCKDQDD